MLQLAGAGASDGERTKSPAAASWREMWRISHRPQRCRWFFFLRCVMIPGEVDARDRTVPQRLIPCPGAYSRASLAGCSARSSRSRAPNRSSNAPLCEFGIHHRSGDDFWLLCPPRRSNQPGLGQNPCGLPAGPTATRDMIDGLVEGKYLRQYEPGMFVFSWIGYKLRDLIKTSFDRKQIGSKSDVSPHLQKNFDFSAARMGQNFPTSRAINSIHGQRSSGRFQWDCRSCACDPFRGDRCLRRAANSLWRKSHELP